MGSFSLAHWAVVALVVLVLFGRGKISGTMEDIAQGIRSFRKGLSEDEQPHGLSAGDTVSPVDPEPRDSVQNMRE